MASPLIHFSESHLPSQNIFHNGVWYDWKVPVCFLFINVSFLQFFQPISWTDVAFEALRKFNHQGSRITWNQRNHHQHQITFGYDTSTAWKVGIKNLSQKVVSILLLLLQILRWSRTGEGNQLFYDATISLSPNQREPKLINAVVIVINLTCE